MLFLLSKHVNTCGASMTEKTITASKGGKARAKALSPKQRSEIARIAAEKRWGIQSKVKRAICGSADSPLRIGSVEIPCYVLEGGARVLSQRGIQAGVGVSTGGGKRGARRLTEFLSSLENKGLDTKGLTARLENPIEFIPPHGGPRAHGYEAIILTEFCDVVLEARKEGKLLKQQENIAKQCEIILRGLAQVGIIALVDEATGYQDIRARDALAKILETFVAKELQKWIKTFPSDYYRELYRLRGLDYPPAGMKMPQYFGHLTNDIVYKRLAPGVLEELKRRTPRDPAGRHRYQLHRRLTEELGHPKLREHLASVVALMKISDRYDEFQAYLDKVHQRYGETIPLPLIEQSEQDAGNK